MFTLVLLLNVIQAAALLSPTVNLDSAVVTGVGNGSVDKFLGIPFALPPTGVLRFRKPTARPPYQGNITATSYGPSCIQQKVFPPAGIAADLTSLLLSCPLFKKDSASESEDCLTLNVIRPSIPTTTAANYPVIVWIYGGGFEGGDTASHDSLGKKIVQQSMAFSSPVIFVSMNYRVSAYGFLASKEVMDDQEGNMGLLDQRFALAWVQKYIGQFGGDKSRVLLWGQSAGAISASLHMLAYGGTTDNLFHSAFMMSGAPIPVGNITGGQKYYDFLVQETGCATSTQTLTCLRQLPIGTLKAAVDKTPTFLSYQSLVLAWGPRADGIFLRDNPQTLVQQGKVASIPFVSGNCDDEGTYFSLSNLNVTSESDFRDYISELYLPKATSSELAPLWTYYPSDLPAGSPFDTSFLNGLSPQFKRLAAIQGDMVFESPRRYFLSKTSGSMKAWSYLSKRQKFIPFAGSYHGSDLDLGLLNDFVTRMAVNHDPNDASSSAWSQYSPTTRLLYEFGSGPVIKDTVREDDFREAQLEYLSNLSLKYPL